MILNSRNNKLKLILHDAISYATYNGNVGGNPLQAAGSMLHIAISGCTLRCLKKSMQSFQKVDHRSTLRNRCKDARSTENRACYTLQATCNLSRNPVETYIAKRIASSNISLRLGEGQGI